MPRRTTVACVVLLAMAVSGEQPLHLQKARGERILVLSDSQCIGSAAHHPQAFLLHAPSASYRTSPLRRCRSCQVPAVVGQTSTEQVLGASMPDSHRGPLYRIIDSAEKVLGSEEDAARGRRKECIDVMLGTLRGVLTMLPVLLSGAREAIAAGAGAGRIAGKAPAMRQEPIEPPPPPRIERQAPSRSYEDPFLRFDFGSQGLPRVRFRQVEDGEGLTPININSPTLKRDAAVLGTLAGAVVAQNELRKRSSGGGATNPVYNCVFQVGLQDTTGMMYALRRLAQRADTTSSTGLASLASNVCLELLACMDGWMAAKTYVSRHKDFAGAEKEFNELSVKERRKWAYEEDHGQPGAPPPLPEEVGRRVPTPQTNRKLMVVTLMVACRRAGKVVPKSLNNANQLEAALEKFAAALLDRDGRNVVAVDCSWTPDDETDILTFAEFRQKWPDLVDV